MSLRRRDPLRDLLVLQERMNRLFEASLLRGRPEEVLETGRWLPLADVYETADAFVVQLELPGLRHDDIAVAVEGRSVTVRGERRMGGARPDRYHRMERSYGPFLRSFQFTEDVDASRVTVQVKDGLLRLELPKARPRSAARERADRS